jgi:hypothetical protein
MNLTRHTYTTRTQKINDFVIGFIGWFILNVIAGGALTTVTSLLVPLFATDTSAVNGIVQTIIPYVIAGLNCLVLLLNLGALIYFGFTRYWIALGALTALAIGLLLTMCLGALIGVLCYSILAGMGGQR